MVCNVCVCVCVFERGFRWGLEAHFSFIFRGYSAADLFVIKTDVPTEP